MGQCIQADCEFLHWLYWMHLIEDHFKERRVPFGHQGWLYPSRLPGLGVLRYIP